MLPLPFRRSTRSQSDPPGSKPGHAIFTAHSAEQLVGWLPVGKIETGFPHKLVEAIVNDRTLALCSRVSVDIAGPLAPSQAFEVLAEKYAAPVWKRLADEGLPKSFRSAMPAVTTDRSPERKNPPSTQYL